MSCYICHQSRWMQEKMMDFLQNFFTRYNDRVIDDDVFLLLEYWGAENRLSDVLRSLPEDDFRRISENGNRRGRPRTRDLDIESDSLHTTLGCIWNRDEQRKTVRRIIFDLIAGCRADLARDDEEEDLFRKRICELQTTLKLTDREIDILLVSFALNNDLLDDPRGGFGHRGGRSSQRLFMMSHCLNTTESDVVKSVSTKSPLRRFDCLDSDLDVNSEIYDFLSGVTDEPLANSYFRKDKEEGLPWTYFADLTRKHGAILKRMLSSGKPVNILLYGAPGTGKTSFARTLASEVKKTCFLISQNTSERGNRTTSSSGFRFGALMVCDAQVEPSGSVIVVDEADDMLQTSGFGGMFSPFGGSSGDKGMLNSVLDSMKTSTIWIANTRAEAIDESSRRRFDYSICFEPLNSEQRKLIWKNNIRRLKLGRLFSAEQLDQFSTLYPVSAGGISQTLENIVKLHPKKAEIPALVEQLMRPHCELLGIRLADDRLLPSKDYSLEGLNIQGSYRLDRIVDAVREFRKRLAGDVRDDADRPRMNLLLSGAPGTGKTEFVKYLGTVLNTKVSVKMGSDLLSKWVGETEQNIRHAFAEAEAEHSILFLDEIDGLVQSRTQARNTWEVTQVNELLYQMENFRGVMIGATNFEQNLDQAVMRRFTFKLEFRFLDNAGKRIFFERMFHTTLTEEEKLRLDGIASLAPGDFRTVHQSLFYYGGEITNAARLDALEHEAEAKDRSSFRERGKIGF